MKALIVSFVVAVVVLFAAPVFADFVNGGFEDGNFTGWNTSGGLWSEDQNTGAISYQPGEGGGSQSVIVSGDTTKDPNTNYNLPEVLTGNHAVRVNTPVNEYHYSTISQTVTWSDPKLYFGWAAVLDEPTNEVHPESAAPYFSLEVLDTTKNMILYQEHFDVYSTSGVTGFNWTDGADATIGSSGIWKYSPWVIINMNTSAYEGDTLSLTLTAADCGWGGHGGYAFLDEFSPTRPIPNTDVTNTLDINLDTVPEPATVTALLATLAASGLIIGKRKLKI